jgi:hypothetical protein
VLREGGVLVSDGSDEVVDVDEDAVLVPLLLAELELLLDPPTSLMLLAALLNTSVVAPLRAPIPATRLPTSKSKRMAYSGADTPASSLPMYRNILVPERLLHDPIAY